MRLAAERTALSWRRTCLGCVAIALLLLRTVMEEGWDAAALIPGVACLVLLTVAALGYRRNLLLHRGAVGSATTTIRCVTAAVVLTALVTTGYVVARPGPPGAESRWTAPETGVYVAAMPTGKPEMDDVSPVRDRLRAALTTAMKARDRQTTALLRATLAAVDNAEAVGIGAQRAGAVEAASIGPGSAEVPRRNSARPRSSRSCAPRSPTGCPPPVRTRPRAVPIEPAPCTPRPRSSRPSSDRDPAAASAVRSVRLPGRTCCYRFQPDRCHSQQAQRVEIFASRMGGRLTAQTPVQAGRGGASGVAGAQFADLGVPGNPAADPDRRHHRFIGGSEPPSWTIATTGLPATVPAKTTVPGPAA